MQENCHLTINVRTIVDIGNTNILFGNIVKGELVSQMRIETSVIVNAQKDNISTDLVELKNFLSDSKSVIISGVVPNAQYELTNFIKSIRDDLKIVELRTSDLEKFISFTLDKPSEVGDDRIINAIAAVKQYEPPLIIVDFGTATTLDVVDKNGSYAGGLICPGVNLSIKSLSDGTALLPHIDFKRPAELIGKDTIHAMESGIYWGYISLIEGLLDKLKKENDCLNAKTIATGGLSKLFAKDLNCINYFENDLTLNGLIIISKKIYE